MAAAARVVAVKMAAADAVEVGRAEAETGVEVAAAVMAAAGTEGVARVVAETEVETAEAATAEVERAVGETVGVATVVGLAA